MSKVSAIWSNSVCGWKQPFLAWAGSDEVKVRGSTGNLQTAPSSSVPSKVNPSGAGLPSPRTISRYLSPNVDR